jgi:hypothetical protein
MLTRLVLCLCERILRWCATPTAGVSRPWTDQPFASNSRDCAGAPRADWTPSALDEQFASMLVTYNDADLTSCIALFKVDLREMQNKSGCGAVLYRTPAGRA